MKTFLKRMIESTVFVLGAWEVLEVVFAFLGVFFLLIYAIFEAWKRAG